LLLTLLPVVHGSQAGLVELLYCLRLLLLPLGFLRGQKLLRSRRLLLLRGRVTADVRQLRHDLLEIDRADSHQTARAANRRVAAGPFRTGGLATGALSGSSSAFS